MGRINSSVGLVSGLNITDTVDKLIAVEGQRRDLIKTQNDALGKQQVAVTDLMARLLNVQLNVKKLVKPDLFESKTVNSSNSGLVSATITGKPQTGTFNYTPLRLAQAQQLLSNGVADRTAAVGTGELTFRYGRSIDDTVSLDQLNGGAGVQRGQIRITDRTGATAQIDLRFARTVGDVLDAINGNSDIQVKAELQGDAIRLVDTSGDNTANLRVQEVGGGRTAADLGLAQAGVGASTYVGRDVFRLYNGLSLAQLNDGRGVRFDGALADLSVSLRDGSDPVQIDFQTRAGADGNAAATVSTLDPGAALQIKALKTGGDYDGVHVRFVADAKLARGQETVTYSDQDNNDKELVFYIAEGKSTADDVAAALARDPYVSKLFSAQTVDQRFASATTTTAGAEIKFTAKAAGPALDGLKVKFVDDGSIAAGNEKATLDLTSKTLTFSIRAGQTTADDVVAAFNRNTDAAAKLSAELVNPKYSSATTDAGDGFEGRLVVTARQPGDAFDGVQVRFVDTPGLARGKETVSYDASNPQAKTLTFRIAAGQTTAADIVAAVGRNQTVGKNFSVELPSGSTGVGVIDTADSATLSGGALPVVNVTDAATLSGGAAGVVSTADTAITSGGAADPGSNEATIGDLLRTINAAAPDKLKATLSGDGDRIVLTDLTTGSGDFKVSSLNESHLAEDLGLVTASDGTITSGRLQSGLGSVSLASLNGGRGLGSLGVLSITDRSGAHADVDLSSAKTLEDVLGAINGSGLAVEADVNASGGGLLLRDTSNLGTGKLTVANGDGTTYTADKLGLAVDAETDRVDGGDLHLQTVSEATRLDALNNGAGVTKGKFTLYDSAGKAALIDLTNPAIDTVGEVIHEINASGIGVHAQLNDNGDGLLIVDTAGGGGTLKAVDIGAGKTASDLRLTGSAVDVTFEKNPAKALDGSYRYKISLDDTTSLDGLVLKINNLNAGVRASVVQDGSGAAPYRLALVSTQTGAAGRVMLDASQTDLNFETTAKAQDALLLLGTANNATGTGGALVSSTSNRFDNVLDGVRLDLTGVSGASAQVTVSNTSTNLVSTVQATVDAYNTLRDKLGEYTSFNPDDNSTGVLFGTNETNRIDGELSEVFSRRFFGVGRIQSFAQVGLTLGQDGKLTLDQSVLQQKFGEDPDAVTEFFTKDKIGAANRLDSLIETMAGRNKSMLVSRAQSLADKIKLNNDRIGEWNARLDSSRQRLLNQFYQMELAIGKIQNNSGAIQAIAPLSVGSSSSSSK